MKIIDYLHHCRPSFSNMVIKCQRYNRHYSTIQLKSYPLLKRMNHFNQQLNSFSINKHSKEIVHLKDDSLLKLIQNNSLRLKNHGFKEGSKLAIIIPPSKNFIATLLSCWSCGGVAVPLCITHPPKEWDFIIQNSSTSHLIYHPMFSESIKHLNLESITPILDEASFQNSNEIQFDWQIDANSSDEALMIYTSGTTGRPKGVIHTHQSIQAMIDNINEAWSLGPNDHILNCLPLHHVHGLINALLAPLYAGGSLEFSKFQANLVLDRLLDKDGPSLFMGVPTMYHRLLDLIQKRYVEPESKRQFKEAMKRVRLLISGSSALPVPLLRNFEEATGHFLLERYGMTEIGMALTNPLEPSFRREGCVGQPFPSAQVRLANEALGIIDNANNNKSSEKITVIEENDVPGEIQVRGPSLFKEYYKLPDATQESFTSDGWFRTGDTALRTKEGFYKILGRTSVDILKIHGYKVSALEIERVLLGFESINEAVVIGIPDKEAEQKIVAFITLKEHLNLEDSKLISYLKVNLAHYKLPKTIHLVNTIEKNAMGKVNKKVYLANYEQINHLRTIQF